MKKILALIACIVLICAMPITAFAESEVGETEETLPVTGVYIPGVGVVIPGTGEIIPEMGATLPETEDTTPETEPPTSDTEEPIPETEEPIPETSAPVPETEPPISTQTPPPESTPTLETTPEPTPEEQAKTTTEKIVAWVTDKFEEISVIITLILTVFYQVRKHAVLNKSIGTLNNNAVTVAESSNNAINAALAEVKSASDAVNGYKEQIALLLAEVGANEEEKRQLTQALTDVTAHLKTAKLANVELANEVAELLVLANIPNSKKEELYSRHLKAVGAIADAEKTEVKEDVDQAE